MPVLSLASRCQYDAGDPPLGGEHLFCSDVEDQLKRLKRSEGTDTCFLFCIAPNKPFCVLLSVLCRLCLSLSVFCRLSSEQSGFYCELFTWPRETGRSWQPSRPAAWRARLRGRRDPGKRSSPAYVPETHIHTYTQSTGLKSLKPAQTV